MEIGILYAFIGSIIWGSMFALSRNVKVSQIFQNIYITLGGLISASLIFVFMQAVINAQTFYAGLISGSLWAFASLSFLYSMKYMGIGRAFPISISGQVIISFLWGVFLFGEVVSSGMSNLLMAVTAVFLVCVSTFFVSRTKENVSAQNFKMGFLAAISSSFFWGTQFVPVKLVSADSFAVMLPFAIGMLVTAFLTALVKFGKNIDLSYPKKTMNFLNGFMWAFGNCLILLAIASIGLAKGFVLSQVGVVIIPPLLGAFYFKEIKERKSYVFLFLAVIILIAGTVLITFAK